MAFLKHNDKRRARKAFEAGNTVVHQLGISSAYLLDILIVLFGTFTLAGGTANGTSTGVNPGNLISKFFVEATTDGVYPAGILKKLSPRSAIASRAFDKGFSIVDSALTGAAGSFTVNQPYELPFALPRLVRPVETALNLKEYTGVQLRIDCGTRDTQFNGNDRTPTYSGLQIDISDYREEMQGDVAVLFEDETVRQIPGANADFAISDFTHGADYIEQLWMAETAISTAQTLSDGIINEITLRVGTDEPFKQAGRQIKAAQRTRITDAAEVMTGLYNVLLSRDGLLTGALPVRSDEQFAASVDVLNPGGANLDRLVVRNRRVKMPSMFKAAS